MNVLGITGRDRNAAAALAVQGRIVAATTEDTFARVPGVGYDLTGGFPQAAVDACLAAAGLDVADIDEVVVVEDGDGHAQRDPARGSFDPIRASGIAAPVRAIPPADADAAHAAMSDPGSKAVLVFGDAPPVLATFHRNDNRLGSRVDIAGADRLVGAARELAALLGLRSDDPFAALDRLSIGAEAEFRDEFGGAFQWDPRTGVTIRTSEILGAARRVSGDHASALADTKSLNVRVQHTRRAVAATFSSELATLVAEAVESVSVSVAAGTVGVGGAVFGNARFNTELRRLVGPALSWSAVPEAVGRALGAAGGTPVGSTTGLALGPAFSEEDIKRTLDNCRLDYVYEPDWPRLLARVSRMLAQGKIVAWFQGAMAFGPRALGTRSILGDPSNRYARQNLNEYLRGLPLDEPLPVVIAPSLANRCFAEEFSPGLGVLDAEVRSEWHPSLVAALDWRQAIRVHGVSVHPSSRLGDLLEVHYANTGTPGLIEANLAGPGEPVAGTPRDAVRTVFSSAIDALVIGRFLLMKDHWLLRSQNA
jgi:carbamoyltransferase